MRDLIDAAVADCPAGSPIAVDVQPRGELPLVRVDAAQLQRVIVNLVENAVKFSPPSEPVDVRVAPRGGARRGLVSDHGPGVPIRRRARIFRPFFRGPHRRPARLGARPRHRPGARRANGATVTLEPADGAGATLVSIPAGPAPDGGRGERRAAHPRRRRRAADPARARGHPVQGRLPRPDRDDGDEALTAAALTPPDLVILDLMLPDADGADVCPSCATGWRRRSS